MKVKSLDKAKKDERNRVASVHLLYGSSSAAHNLEIVALIF